LEGAEPGVELDALLPQRRAERTSCRPTPSDFASRALLDEFGGSVNLIYIDPPFYTGDDFSMKVKLEGAEFEKQPSAIEQKAYRDTWGVSPADRKKGITSLDRYLRWFADAAVHLYELLSPNGSIFVHLDWHVAAYAKVLLDEIFGASNFRNEVVWCYTGPGSPGMQQFNRKHDNILWYTKGESWASPTLLTWCRSPAPFGSAGSSPTGSSRGTSRSGWMGCLARRGRASSSSA
jgi:hypothetical protein